MSVLLVPNHHVNVIATHAASLGLTNDPAGTALCLWNANLAAVRHAYHDEDIPTPQELVRRFVFHDAPCTSKATIYYGVRCLEYNSQDHPDWVGSEAQILCHAIRAPLEPLFSIDPPSGTLYADRECWTIEPTTPH